MNVHQSSAPILQALVSLSGSVNVSAIKKALIEGATEGAVRAPPKQHDAMEGIQSEGAETGVEGAVKGSGGQVTVSLHKHKARISVVEAPGDILGCLEAAKVRLEIWKGVPINPIVGSQKWLRFRPKRG